MSKRIDIINSRFGKLTVLSMLSERNKHGWHFFRCRCDCGNLVKTTSQKLRAGDRTSCGCYMKAFDIAGQRFGKLTVLSKDNSARSWKQQFFRCQCDCGAIAIVLGSSMRRGITKSCGCLRHQSPPNKTHGRTNSKIHRIWAGMLRRCTNLNSPDYPEYGGRGITVCERWKTFSNFFEDMGDAPSGKSLDRRDNSKGYSPENCRWATPTEQANNTRKNHLITAFGRTLTRTEWGRSTGLKPITIKARLRAGWTAEAAVSTPVHAAASSIISVRSSV